MLSGVKDILVITTKFDLENYQRLLGDGSGFGISIEYATQNSPDGIAQAFIIGQKFINNESVALILGDNIFYGQNFPNLLEEAVTNHTSATIFGYYVEKPERFGVINFENDTVIKIDEKPIKPKSNYAVSGLYFYDNNVIEIAKSLKPSDRGELEITDVNNHYIFNKNMKVKLIDDDIVWLDTGTHEALIQASQDVYSIETNTNKKIACLEEIAFNNKWISLSDLDNRASLFSNTPYGDYLLKLVKNK
jgi:glucose-1-phosphate thymidylyltransferase